MSRIRFGHSPSKGILDEQRKKPRSPKKSKKRSTLLSGPQQSRLLTRGARDTRVQTGDAFGYLTVLPGRRNRQGDLIYHTRCECGRRSWLGFTALRLRKRYEVGCLKSGCQFTPDRFLYWTSFDHCSLFQWVQMVNAFPHLTDPEWGGSLSSVLEPAENGLEAFRSWLNDNRSGKLGHWWVQRIDPLGVWADWNCRVVDRPDEKLLKSRRRFATYYGASLPVEQWAEILNVPAETISFMLDDTEGDNAIEELQKSKLT